MKALILVTAILLLTSCSHSVLVKDCQPVVDSNKSACRLLKPWE